MKIEKTVIVTGAAGGIGQSMCEIFNAAGYMVIGTDQLADPGKGVHKYVQADLDQMVENQTYREKFFHEIKMHIPDVGLKCLINNAALQIRSHVDKLSTADWQKTFNVNVTAPFLLVQSLLGNLRVGKGSVINIGSIHSRLSKPEFMAYAASKAALDSLTRGLAMDLGGEIRVNSINPAAIDTPMLREGFVGRPEALASLHHHHPSGRIGVPHEVARMALYMASDEIGFLNGSNINLDGGIGGRLHDPS